MCGIVGVSLSEPRAASASARDLATAGLARLEHRGPDAGGVSGDARSAVAMCHLRVRSGAAVPVPFHLGGTAVAYNGEVYRAAGGIPADGPAEARALLGAEASGLDGMWAIAARAADGTIEARRDPLGIKPLYARSVAGAVAIASEPRALLEIFGPARVRRAAVAQFLLFGQVVDEEGWFEDIVPVPAGGRLRLRDGRVESSSREEMVAPSPEPPTAADLRAAVGAAVERAAVADRPLGLALSGGLDSSILADELARLEVEDVRTVSVLFDGTERLDGVADLASLDLPGAAWRDWAHRWDYFRPAELLDGLAAAVDDLGAPTSLAGVAMYARMARLASESGVVALLLGEGADELFGGYRSYLSLAPGRSAVDFYAPGPRRLAAVEALVGRDACASGRATLLEALPEAADGPAVVRQFELRHSLRPLLRRADALLMRHGIEGRVPFLHGEVPAMAFGLDWDDLVSGGQTKVALRRAYSERLPRFRNERKQPFRAPLDAWGATVADDLRERLLARESALGALGIDVSTLSALSDPMGRDADSGLAFRLLALGEWFDLHLHKCLHQSQMI